MKVFRKKSIAIKLPVLKSQNYEIKIQSGLCNDIKRWIPKNFHNIVIITDNNVAAYYASSFVKQLKRKEYNVLLLTFPAGERSKNLRTKQNLEEEILSYGYERRETLILALGGGVVGDISGFIAGTYMRGIPYIQIPTTLLAMVDSSVGGKVAVNTSQGKNLIGMFWHPIAVMADIDFLKTLDKKHIISGCVEIVKMFLTHDAAGFEIFNKKLSEILALDQKCLLDIINKAVCIKSKIVSKDEKEAGERETLNFGHTIGHALEKISHYKMLHGYAVGYGILVEAKISQLMGILSEKDYLIIETCLAALGIHKKAFQKYGADKIIELTQADKKKKLGAVHYVLLKKIGRVYVSHKNYSHPVPEKMVRNAILHLQRAR